MIKKIKKFLFGTLRGRLIVSVAVVHALMMAIFVIDLTMRQRSMLLELQTEEAVALSHSLATSAGEWIVSHDISGLQELIDAQNHYPEIVYAIMADSAGQVLAATDKSREGLYMQDLPGKPISQVISASSSLVDVVCPAIISGRHVGWVRIGIGQKKTGARLAEITRDGFYYTIFAILIGSVIAYFMGKQVSGRLYNIQSAINAVRSGNSKARSAITGSDEAAFLGREFNSMLDSLEASELELKDQEKKTRSLLRLSQKLEQSQSFDEALKAAEEEIRQIIGYQNLWAYIPCDDKKYFNVKVARSVDSDTLPLEEGTVSLPEQIVYAKEFTVIPDAREDEKINKEVSEKLKSRTIISIPVILYDQYLGTFGTGTFGNEGVKVPADLEKDFLKAIASHLAVVFDRIRLLGETKKNQNVLVQLNRELRAISNCNQVLMRAENEQSLLEEICNIIYTEAGYRMVWVGYVEFDEECSVRPVASGGIEEGYLENAKITWADTERGQGPTGRAIRSGKTICTQDFFSDPYTSVWRESAARRGYRSSIALPLKDDSNKVFGVLNIYSSEPNIFVPDETRLLEELASDLAFGIMVLRNRAALHRSTAIMENLFSSIHTLLAYMDRNFNFLKVNRAYAAADNHEPEYFTGKNHFDLYPDEENKAFFKKVVDTGESIYFSEKSFEYVEHPEWGVSYWDWSLHPVKSPEGKVEGLVLSLLDVTDKVRARQDVEEAAAYSRSLIEVTLDPLVTINPDGKISDVNSATEYVTGASRNELIGTDFSDYFTEPEKAKKGYRQAFKQGFVRDYALSIRHKDGHTTPVLYNAAPYHDTSGNVIGIFAAARDITGQKKAEEEIQKLNHELEERVIERTAQLKEANDELEAFAYSVSHDLRAPLRHINSFLNLLSEETRGTLSEDSIHFIDVIGKSTMKMARLIEDLLSFSRMGRNDMVKIRFDLKKVVNDVISDLAPETTGRSINWVVEELPEVEGDPAMIQIAMVNLISNALKFTKNRKTAEIRIGCSKGNENETVFFIKDNGVGFDNQYNDKLFNVFQRFHREEEYEGTGIGLANVRRIIKRHGGKTWAEGEVDHGATFYFSLPAASA